MCSEFGPLDGVALETIDAPVPGKGEVLISVRVAGINFPDLLIVQGKYQARPALPFVPGGECAGVVEAVGDGVAGVGVGDRVIAVGLVGAFGEKMTAAAVATIPVFGLEPEITVLRWGRERMAAAHRFMERALAFVRDLVEKHELDSDYRHNGFVRVSYTPGQLKRLRKNLDLYRSLGIEHDLRYLTAEELRSQLQTERYLGGLFERETGLLNPCKHVRELKRLAEAAGAQVFEESPVVRIRHEGGGMRVETPDGSVRAEKLVLATNSYSRKVPDLPRIRSRQTPAWTYLVVTDPLSDAQWESIGWADRQGFEDSRQLVHYFRPTVDGRIAMGGGDAGTLFSDGMDHDFSPRIWRHLEEHLHWIFPQLSDVGFAYR